MSSIPAERSTDRRFYGVVEGLVVEIEKEGEGRVKVAFPWLDRETRSEWCRVSHLYAGAGFGALFVPEEGTEVVISFIHGDMRQPIILGGLYNGQDKPTHRPDNKDHKVIRTRAGHQLLFDDTDGEHKIEIKDSGENNHILIDTQEGQITVTASGGKLVLQANEIEINAESSVTVNGQSVSVTAGGEMSLSASGQMTVEGSTIHLN